MAGDCSLWLAQFQYAVAGVGFSSCLGDFPGTVSKWALNVLFGLGQFDNASRRCALLGCCTNLSLDLRSGERKFNMLPVLHAYACTVYAHCVLQYFERELGGHFLIATAKNLVEIHTLPVIFEGCIFREFRNCYEIHGT